jgi:hypothetical protein
MYNGYYEPSPQTFPNLSGGALRLTSYAAISANINTGATLSVRNLLPSGNHAPIAEFFRNQDNGSVSGVSIHYIGSNDNAGALRLVRTSGNPNGLYIPWSGSRNAIRITHNSAGDGIYIDHSGSSSSNGIYISKTGSTTGAALNINTASGSAKGMNLISGSSGDGIYIEKSGSTGEAIDLHSTGTTSGLLISKSSSNHAIEISETGTGNGLDITSSGGGIGIDLTASGSGVGSKITYSGSTNAMVIDDNATSGADNSLRILKEHGNSSRTALRIDKDARAGYAMRIECDNTTSAAHASLMARFHVVDNANYESPQFDIDDVGPHVALHVTHDNNDVNQFNAVEFWQEGPGAPLRLYHNGIGLGWLIDCENDAPGGGAINVLIDSSTNDSNAVQIEHEGLGSGIYVNLSNGSNTKNAIHAKVNNSSAKALYAEGNIECTKQIVAKGIKCHYEYDSASGNPTANNLATGTIFSCYDTFKKEWRLAIKTGDGKADYFISDGSMNIDNP